jgi:hypothetical protein
MANEISYFDLAAFLAEIESVDIDDPVNRTQWLWTISNLKDSRFTGRT